jgi:hypothetical protein
MMLTRSGGTDWHIRKVNRVWGVVRLIFLEEIESGLEGKRMVASG